MLHYPHFDPIALSIGPLSIHWYGLMYLLGFLMAWSLAHWRNRQLKLNWSSEAISDLIYYAALGVILGGRIGYMIFYAWQHFIHAPWILFKLWEGGMSFHGGLIGVLIALYCFAKKTNRSVWQVTDFTAPLVPLALAAGRIGNFINGELWGRVTSVPWAMCFEYPDQYPRHPSSLYEAGLEGILLFVIVFTYANTPRTEGKISAVFLIGYSLARMTAECFRAPDPHIGFIAFGWLTEGQLLSIPMLLLGLWLWRRRQAA